VGATGYDVANELALGNLRLGNSVVVDGVNPVAESREAWRQVASAADVRLINVQVVCSDAAQHRRRIETRDCDVPGLKMPDWGSVQSHEFEPWAKVPFTLDTATLSVEEASGRLLAYSTVAC
jgi:predicted kinase